MAEPVQLRYTDTNDNEQVIGTYLREDNLIQQFEMKNSGSGEFTRIELIADKQFKDNLPIDYTQYGTPEPEIRVYIDDGSGGWKLRDRVFAEKSGVLDDEGKYRNDEFWGFQKWVGRQRTPSKVSESNSDITTIVNSLLPSGYVAQTPGGDTVPTLDNYTFNGKRDRAFRDLVRDYPIKLWFTAETDGNGDYIVKVQSKGFGGVVQSVSFTDERQTSGYQIIEFDEEDKSNIVNKVEVEGVDSNGATVRATASNSASISEHGERYVHRSVGYIESQTQAQNIADDILNPDPSPHAVMSVGFIDENAINASIDVTDDRFGINAVYTIVKQRDFMTEGKTEVELSFEKNRSEERRNLDRDLDEKNHQLFPTNEQDVGSQNADLDTGPAPSDTQRDPDTGLDGDFQGENINSVSLPLKEGTSLGTINVQLDAPDSPASQVTQDGDTIASYDGQALAVTVTNFASDTMPQVDITVTNQSDGGTVLATDTLSPDVGESLTFNDFFDSSEISQGDTVNVNFDENSAVGADFESASGENFFTNFKVTLISKSAHFIGDDIDTEDFDHGGAGNPDGQHGASGTTDSKNVDIPQEDKTNR